MAKVTSDHKELIGITDVVALTLWIASVAGKHFTVRFEPDAETAYVTADNQMVFPSLNSKVTKADAIKLRGFCLHETSHAIYQPKIWDVMKANPVPPHHPLGGVYNLLLDVHAETMRANAYAGDAKALSEFGVVVGHTVYDRMVAGLKRSGGKWPPNFEKMAGCMVAARNAEATWNVGMLIGFEKLVNTVYTQEIRDLADAIGTKFPLTARLVDNCTKENEQSIWDLSKEVYKFVWGEDPDEVVERQKEKEKGKGKDKEEGEGSEKKEKEKKDKPEDGDGGKAKKPSSDKSDEKDNDETPLDEKIKVTELLFSDHYETLVGKGNGQGFDFSNYHEYSVYRPVDPREFKVVNYSKGETY